MLGAGQRTPTKSIEIVGATWPRLHPLSGKNCLCACWAFPTQSCVPNLKCLAQVVSEIFDHMPKTVAVMWPRPHPLSGKLFVRPLGIPHIKLHTKCEVSSSSSFRDIAL